MLASIKGRFDTRHINARMFNAHELYERHLPVDRAFQCNARMFNVRCVCIELQGALQQCQFERETSSSTTHISYAETHNCTTGFHQKLVLFCNSRVRSFNEFLAKKLQARKWHNRTRHVWLKNPVCA